MIEINIEPDTTALAAAAAACGAGHISRAIATKGEANIVVATGAS